MYLDSYKPCKHRIVKIEFIPKLVKDGKQQLDFHLFSPFPLGSNTKVLVTKNTLFEIVNAFVHSTGASTSFYRSQRYYGENMGFII